MNNAIKLFSAFVLGAAAGLATGILMAPDKGDKTRKKLLKEVDKASKDLSLKADEQIERIKEGYNKTVEEISKEGKVLIEQAKKAVSAN